MNRKVIFIIIFVLALLGAGYNIYQSSRVVPKTDQVYQGGNDLVKDISKLRHLKDSKLDITLFKNPLYKNLESSPDLSPTPTPSGQEQKVGRANPFLPVPGTSVATPAKTILPATLPKK